MFPDQFQYNIQLGINGFKKNVLSLITDDILKCSLGSVFCPNQHYRGNSVLYTIIAFDQICVVGTGQLLPLCFCVLDLLLSFVLREFASIMEKQSPIILSSTESLNRVSFRFVQVFHRHGDRSPLKNYCEGTDMEQAEIDTWKSLVIIQALLKRIVDSNRGGVQPYLFSL